MVYAEVAFYRSVIIAATVTIIVDVGRISDVIDRINVAARDSLAAYNSLIGLTSAPNNISEKLSDRLFFFFGSDALIRIS